MFEVRDLTKQFDATTALQSVSLGFPGGQVTALMGENGAGKSTLLNILAGVLPASSGGVYIDGRLARLRSSREARAHGIAIIPQEPLVIGSLTIAENIFLGSMPTKGHVLNRSRLFDQADALLAETGFQGILEPKARAATLSPSGCQVIEILRAVVADPEVIAFDEPTSSLGQMEVDRLRDLINSLKEKSLAIIYVSHRRAEIEDLATRVAVLRDGRLVAVHDTGKIEFRQLLQEVGGREPSEGLQHVGQIRDGEPLISLRNASTKKLKNVSVSVRPGEIVGVAGLAGSGRSELTRALVGDVQLTKGSITLGGVQLRGRRRVSPRDTGIGYIPEDRRKKVSS